MSNIIKLRKDVTNIPIPELKDWCSRNGWLNFKSIMCGDRVYIERQPKNKGHLL